MTNEGRSIAAQSDIDGFTLIEILVVLTILGTLSAIALPRLRLSEGTQLRQEAQSVAVDLRGLREDAAKVSFVAAIVRTSDGYGLVPSGRIRSLPPGTILKIQAETSLLASSDAEIRFFPDGSSTGGTIFLEKGSSSASVSVRGFDGRVRVDGR